MKNNQLFDNVNDLISFIQSQRKFTNNLSLDKMRFLSSLFNNPHEKFKSIHVGGTNGKGSTVSLLASIYRSAGYNVATFTSPYIVCFNERIQFNGEFISDEDLLRYGNLILSKYDDLEINGFNTPTFFEFITMVAFLYFSDLKNLDIAIIEVGMGGRLDATNIITPLISVITNISFDHMEQLGNTLELICKEKLGIVKENVPFVTTINNDSLIELCIQKTNQTNSKFLKVDFEKMKIDEASICQSVFSYKDLSNITTTNLLGYHQIENICLCIDVVRTCNDCYKNLFYINDNDILQGISNTKWPGRFEKIKNDPLIYVDGGHNIDCIKRITEFLSKQNIKQKRAVVAISKDKAVKEMIDILDDNFDQIIFTNYLYSRSDSPNHLFDISNSKNKLCIENLNDAINFCFECKYEFTIFIGSLYLISDVRKILINK